MPRDGDVHAGTDDSTKNVVGATNDPVPAALTQTAPPADGTATEPGGNTAIQRNNGTVQDAQLPGVPSEAAQNLRLGDDQINLDIARLAMRTGAVQNNQEAGQEEETSAFDTLPVDWNEKEKGGKRPPDFPEDLWDLKAAIGKQREGNLYKAVLVARELRSGRNNPMAMGRARRYLAKGKGVGSSVLDTASDVNKVFASTVAIANTIDREGKYKPVLQGAALVSNFISLVTTSRDIFLKIKNLKGGSKTDKFFKVIALCGDFATLMSKACSIAKTITNYFGAGNKIPGLKEATKWIILALNMGSQLAGITNASRTIHAGRQKYKGLEEKEKNLWDKDVLKILKDNGASEDAHEEGGMEEPEKNESEKEDENKGEAVKEASEKGESTEAGVSVEDPEELRGYKRQRAVEQMLMNPQLKEEEKDKLIEYLAVTRRKDKLGASLAATTSGLVASVTGLCSSLFTATVYGASYSQKAASKMPGVGTAGMSVFTNSVAIGNIAMKTFSNTSNRGDSRTDLISDRLWSKLETLGEEQYGLKGLEDDLTTGPGRGEDMSGKKATAEKAEKMYNDTAAQFTSMEVAYDSLLKAHNEETFKKILAAGV